VKGDPVMVFYDPTDPSSADTGRGRMLAAILPAVAGVSFGIVSVGLRRQSSDA
jgi:hypothetical protein